jgi:hypothetical protein
LLVYTQLFRRGKPTGVSFIDSTPLKVCHNLATEYIQTLC